MKTVIEVMDVPLEGPIYDGVHAHLSVEVRDFLEDDNRTMVVRFWIDGTPYTAMVGWDKFTEEFDAMRARMMTSNWDDALSILMTKGDST